MRFYVSEHKAFLTEIETTGLSSDKFSFSKKGGVLFVRYGGHQQGFTFHRKKESVLDNNNQWAKKVTYYFDKPGKTSFPTDWEGILFGFRIWLKGIELD